MVLFYKQSHPYIDWEVFIRYLENNELIQLILEIDLLCESLNCNAYIVGGTLRDFFLGRKNKDMDIVIEGNGLVFSKILSNQLQYSIKSFEGFLTATLQLPAGQKVDFITSRSEEYIRPGSLPIIHQASIYEDLRRRDFSINCLAIQINSNDKGRFFDLFGGLQDLEDKKIRILHDNSFVDDPTRIFRAMRYSQRFDFIIEPHTLSLFTKAITKGVLLNLSKERLSQAFISIFAEEETSLCLEDLWRQGVLKVLFPFYSFSLEEIKKTNCLKIERYKTLFNRIQGNYDPVLLKLLLVFSQCNENDWQSIKNILSLNKKYSHCVLQMIEYREKIRSNFQKSDLNQGEVYQLLCPLYTEVILSYAISLNHPLIQQYCELFLFHLKQTKLLLTGKDLYALGVHPGKTYGIILEHVLMAKLNQKITTFDEELEYVRFLLNNI